MSEIKIREIGPSFRVGEGPHYVERDQSLMYVDVISGDIHKYSLKTNKSKTLHIDDSKKKHVAFVIPVEGEKDIFAIGVGPTLSIVQWPEEGQDYQQAKPYHLLTVDKHVEKTRLNDAKCDPNGRLWTGTMDDVYGLDLEENKGSLYRINENLESTRVVKEVSLSNGLAWSSNQKILYYNDSLTFKIEAFDYDIATGNISNRRTVLDFKEHNVEGAPDGMTIDVNDKLWTSCFGAAQVINVDPAIGKVESIVKLPSLQTTSCCWGGPDYSTLFVTSANLNLKPEEVKKYPSAGKTFAVTGLGTKGLKPKEFRLKKDYIVQYLQQ